MCIRSTTADFAVLFRFCASENGVRCSDLQGTSAHTRSRRPLVPDRDRPFQGKRQDRIALPVELERIEHQAERCAPFQAPGCLGGRHMSREPDAFGEDFLLVDNHRLIEDRFKLIGGPVTNRRESAYETNVEDRAGRQLMRLHDRLSRRHTPRASAPDTRPHHNAVSPCSDVACLITS